MSQGTSGNEFPREVVQIYKYYKYKQLLTWVQFLLSDR